MLAIYNLSDMDEIVSAMIEYMYQQIEKPALRDSKFVFDGVINMDIDFHRLNVTRGSSYMPLPDWLAKKGAIINPKNSDMECFKWAVIAMKWKDIDNSSNVLHSRSLVPWRCSTSLLCSVGPLECIFIARLKLMEIILWKICMDNLTKL